MYYNLKKSSISRAWNIMEHMRLINFNGTHDTIMEQVRLHNGTKIMIYLAKLAATQMDPGGGDKGGGAWGLMAKFETEHLGCALMAKVEINRFHLRTVTIEIQYC
jgi:hypothetical protein